MIRFEQVTVTYHDAAAPTLRDLDLTVPEGELCLLVGPSGVGKSTLLGAVSGLVPHFTGGTLRGRVTVDGRDTRTHRPRELADVVGTVGQDPLAHFVTDTVEEELAYGMESLGMPADTMRRRVEETLDLLGLADLRDRALRTLSGGQQQRVAIGSVLTTHPRVLVLDEPTSALDPAAAEEVLAVLQRLVHDLGTTVLLAEHRLERVVQYADRVVLLPGPGEPPVVGGPGEVMAVSPVHPPVVALGRLAGWTPPPLTVRDARRAAAPLRARLADVPPPAAPAAPAAAAAAAPRGLFRRFRRAAPAAPPAGTPAAVPAAEVTGLAVRHGRVDALRGLDLTVRPGETIALMGRNGAGKSTLLRTLVGMHEPARGAVRTGGAAPHRTGPRELLRHVGLVPQEPRDLLCADTVGAECAAADRDASAAPGTCRDLVSDLLPGVPDDAHPRDLSEGQRLALALAVVLAARPPLLLLDEPTRGLDYAAKARLVEILRGLAAEGHAIVLATHDVELAAELAHRVVVLAEGEIVADGPTADVVVASPAFAPQVAKVLAPLPWLTVAQVRGALGAAGAGKGGSGTGALGPSASETGASGTGAPETGAPETGAPETDAPETTPTGSNPSRRGDPSETDTSGAAPSGTGSRRQDTPRTDPSRPDLPRPNSSRPDPSRPDPSQPNPSRPDLPRPDRNGPNTPETEPSGPSSSGPDPSGVPS
ncbi:ABC transporter ATP-binding protein [Streptomyces mobaraensis NBRC 13819 = DSM 40847]|uniref:ABC transporter ATP-binding protein n=1 Tax=Streptomyces mobaraensis (strain ATCC 29032 / DSM 40847 / JCM 4168 / NBRC 13819 / NCIMB 11159 / IPCR 16-22) TaxID=1223523 RepID=M3AU85_STRM1|nr:ABC transporter ATP-binding protein [Streptomyces mobaraensis NBRC 13819 = DSM 40847]